MFQSRSILIAGLTVSRCILDKVSFILEFLTVNDLCLVKISQPFELISVDRYDLDPEKPDQLGPALAAIQQRVVDANIESSGMLIVRIEGTGTFRVAPSPEYEGWEVVGSRGSRSVSIAGGEVVYWPEQS